MSTVVTLRGYTPIPRFDATRWTTARLEEAASDAADATWTAIQTFTLPADADPENPATHDFTSAGATLENGWYRIVWVDAASHESVTPPVQNIDTTLAYQPAVNDVSALLWARTRDSNGNTLGVFTGETTPTYEQALNVTQKAARDVAMKIGLTIPDRLVESAQGVVALLAAARVELSFFPDQLQAGRSPYTELNQQYKDALAELVSAVAEADAADGVVDDLEPDLLPVFGFPSRLDRAPGGEIPWPASCWWRDW